MKTIERRNFLRNASCAALGSTTVVNTLLNLSSVNAAANFNSSVAGGDDYKALVCILLGGGSDSFNMLIPTTPDEHAKYATTRTNLTVPNFDCNDPDNPDNALSLGTFDCNASPQSPPTHGMNPYMPKTRNLYNQGKLAWVSNVGTLIEPVTKPNVWNSNLPLGLFSHIDQVAHWQTALPQDRVATGWGGKMAELLSQYNIEQDKVAMNMSFSGSNIYQTGVTSIPFSLSNRFTTNNPFGGAVGFQDFGEWENMEDARQIGVNNIVDATYQDIFKQTFRNTMKAAKDGYEEFSSAYENAHDFNMSVFNNDDMSRAMEVIARTVSVQSQLQMKRQVFFIEVGGWDHHDGLGDDYNYLLSMIDDAMDGLNSALESINMADCVTTFTISEFGRTLSSNGNGSDHAWGGNMMVMGGAVNGGQIYGQYPSLELGDNNDLEIGGGTLIPTTSADEYFAEIARWFGVMNSDLPLLFPNIDKFYDIMGTTAPLGFMQT